ncbi:hypothetical protein Hanom_Chr17g01568721 [Helianthus anomalus]
MIFVTVTRLFIVLCVLTSFGKGPSRHTMQQLNKPKKTELSIGVPDPIMQYGMNRNRWSKTKFLK